MPSVLFQRWFNALTDHIGFATHFIHAGERQESTDSVPIATIDEAFQVIKGECNIDNKSEMQALIKQCSLHQK